MPEIIIRYIIYSAINVEAMLDQVIESLTKQRKDCSGRGSKICYANEERL